MQHALASLLVAATALAAAPAHADTELSVVLPILPRQVDAPGEGFFPRLLPHEFVVRTDGPRAVAILVGQPLARTPGEPLRIDPATASPLLVGVTTPVLDEPSGDASDGTVAFELRGTWRVPRGLSDEVALAVEAVSVPHGSADSEGLQSSGAIGLRAVDAVWIDPNLTAGAWKLRSEYGLNLWNGPIGGLPRGSQVELLLTVSMDRPAGTEAAGPASGLRAVALLPDRSRMRWAGEPVAPASHGSTTPGIAEPTLLEFELSVPTDARGEARVLLFEASRTDHPRIRAILAERR